MPSAFRAPPPSLRTPMSSQTCASLLPDLLSKSVSGEPLTELRLSISITCITLPRQEGCHAECAPPRQVQRDANDYIQKQLFSLLPSPTLSKNREKTDKKRNDTEGLSI